MKSTRVWLAAIVVLYLVFAVAYNLVTPAGTAIQHNPDENGHLQYVQLLSTGHLPVFTTAAAGPEFHQPPLYYLICAPVYASTKGLGASTSIHCVRAVSTALGLFLILVAFRTAKRLFPDDDWVALLTAGLVALLPMNVAMNASVGNDSLTNLLVAAGLAVLAEIGTFVGDFQNEPERVQGKPAPLTKKTVILGVILGLVILTKSSALVLYPAVLVAFALLGYRKLLTSTTAVRSAAIAIAVGVLVGSPWLIRNMMLYGDPLGQKIFQQAFQSTTAPAEGIMRLVGGLGPYASLMVKWTFASFWGVFDSMTAFWGHDPHPVLSHVPPYAPMGPRFEEPLPVIYNMLAALTVAGLIGAVVRLRRGPVDPAKSSILWSFVLLILATAYGFTMFTLQFFQAQGRYWFTALVPLALFFALGYRGLFPREAWFRVVTVFMILGLVALNAYTIWGLLVPRFASS